MGIAGKTHHRKVAGETHHRKPPTKNKETPREEEEEEQERERERGEERKGFGWQN